MAERSVAVVVQLRSWPMRLVAHLAIAASVSLALATVAPAAWADCAQDDRSPEQQVEEAGYVFVGTVTEVTNSGRTATFEVDEVWVRPSDGATLGSEVVVHGGPGEPNVTSSVERTFETGVRYLVFPHVDGGRFTDDICTPTTTWTEALADARPADAQSFDDDPDLGPVATATSTPWIIVGVTVLVVVVAGAIVAARRRGQG